MENLQPEIFVNEILETCILRNRREELQAAIKKIDPHMNRSWNYLTSCCQYLLEKNLSDHLYSFQVSIIRKLKLKINISYFPLMVFLNIFYLFLKLFMKEYGKAAIRCLKQYLEVDSIELKMGFLNRAEQHFNEALLVNI